MKDIVQTSTPIFVTTENEATVVCLTGVEPPMVSDTVMELVTILTVGGEFLPIDSTALFVSGIQTSAVFLVLTKICVLAWKGFDSPTANVKSAAISPNLSSFKLQPDSATSPIFVASKV